ncbi:tRNA (adenosine(37)-N6)-threonylcarbamoyltransferase complex transferase subunit TsaD [bacterium]|nr:tRNA (adenosine(37)-N6)-threonylcarbamoyltransferase complex transferase subunit TsaD [bacterium]
MAKILAFDTSCDDTSAAVVDDHFILSNVVSSQISLHQPYGGVFPTVAKLAHRDNIVPVTQLALKRARLEPDQLDAVGVTIGPGLAPALEIGVNYAKQFAATYHLPLVSVNHIEGHLLSPLLAPNVKSEKIPLPEHFPYPHTLGIIVSGGHSQFVKILDYGHYQTLGETLDDAAGEALDKIGRMLGLGYPAAPVIEELAKSGDPTRFPFPLPLTSRHDFDLSFSGLKTHALHLVQTLEKDGLMSQADLANAAASSQFAVFRHLLYKFDKLVQSPSTFDNGYTQNVFLGGGVSANLYLRKLLRTLGQRRHFRLYTPKTKQLCGDNAAMIALVAHLKYQRGQTAIAAEFDRTPDLILDSWNK